MKKLWEKDWQLNETVEAFETRGDMEMGQKLAEFDVYCSLAHVKMLNSIDMLSDLDLNKAEKGLKEVLSLVKKGKFKMEIGDEDIHTKIEGFITEKYAQSGKKIHVGISRSDQALTDVRLYTKTELIRIWKMSIELAESFCKFAKKYEFIPMVGYTHMQKAMPSSIGMWAASFAEAILDDLRMLKTAYYITDRSPLGSAASYGVPLALDRKYTSKLLGFGNVQQNSLYCHTSRNKLESEVIFALSMVLFDINRFCNDVMLFTTAEFDYFDVDRTLCTGSSIMPQKKNVDVAELLRGKIHLMLGYYLQSASLSTNLISGYSREVQDGKKPLLESLDLASESIHVAKILLEGITPKKEKLEKGLSSETFAAYKAIKMTSEGKAFRDAYSTVGRELDRIGPENIRNILKISSHIGGTGNLGIEQYMEQLSKEKKIVEKEDKNFKTAIQKLVNG